MTSSRHRRRAAPDASVFSRPEYVEFPEVACPQHDSPPKGSYTDPWPWIDVERAVPLYFPVLADIDQEKVTCYDVVAPFDDHLAEVTLPILYVGAAGGFGERGYYAVTLTSSTDITKSIVQLHLDREPALDFGLADLFTATSAETLVWQPILNWLVTHK